MNDFEKEMLQLKANLIENMKKVKAVAPNRCMDLDIPKHAPQGPAMYDILSKDMELKELGMRFHLVDKVGDTDRKILEETFDKGVVFGKKYQYTIRL